MPAACRRGCSRCCSNPGYALGQRLVADPRIKAVGFTGSRRAGLALIEIAQARSEPIPVYAEMSSIIPVLLHAHALAERARRSPRVLLPRYQRRRPVLYRPRAAAWHRQRRARRIRRRSGLARKADSPAATMLTPGILKAYGVSVAALTDHEDVTTIARGAAGDKRARAGFFKRGRRVSRKSMNCRMRSFPRLRLLCAVVIVTNGAVIECLDGATHRASIHAAAPIIRPSYR